MYSLKLNLQKYGVITVDLVVGKLGTFSEIKVEFENVGRYFLQG